jgi:hypothetical protein
MKNCQRRDENGRKSGGLKFRFLPRRFLPPLRSKFLLPSSSWIFFRVFFFVFFAAGFFAVSAHDDPFAEPTQMPLLQRVL